MKEYKKTVELKAIPYKEGMEDGFDTRYYSDEDVDEDGMIHTSGLMGDKEIKVPYILRKGYKLLTGDRYYIIYEDGEPIKAIIDKEFNKKKFKWKN